MRDSRSSQIDLIHDPRILSAIAEIEDLIRAGYPAAQFAVGEGDDPCGVYLDAIVDADDLDDVTDLFIDRLAQMQTIDGLPLYVLTRPTPARAEQIARENAALRAARAG